MVRMSSWNTVPMRPLTTPKPFNTWGVAVLTYLLGTAVTLVLGFVLGMAGFLLMTGMALQGNAGDVTTESLTDVTVRVALGIGLVSLAVEAWFIHRRGGARPVIAPIAARAASLLLGFAITPLALTDGVAMVLGAAVEIAVLGALIRPRR
jgi:hypothetical protein